MSPQYVRTEPHVLTIEQIEKLTASMADPAETLSNVVQLIAERFATEVCSAYLLEPDRMHLLLAASVGLQKSCVGTLRLALQEGLVGLVAEKVSPVAVQDAFQHPRFRYFPETGEDRYRSFLGVPFIDEGILQG